MAKTMAITGLDSLMSKLETMSEIGTKYSNKAVKEAAESMLEQLKADAPKKTGRSASKLAIIEKRTALHYAYYDVGIGASNFQDCRGLYFHHYGFKGKSASMWLTSSFEKSKGELTERLKQAILKEISL